MRAAVLAFLLGIFLLQQQASLPDRRWLLLLPVALAVALACSLCRRPWLRLAALAVTGFAVGFLWAQLRAELRLADALSAAWEGRDVEVVGVVASLPRLLEHGTRFEFDVEAISPADAQVPSRLALTWYRRGEENGVRIPPVSGGERWRFTVRLRRPHGTANPHGFDYEAWLLERGIRATGYVRDQAPSARLGEDGRPSSRVLRAREAVRERLRTVLEGRPYAGVIAALAIGDQDAIPRSQWEVFTRTGVNHLMSISGLHITMVSGLVFGLVHALWRRIPPLALRLPSSKAAVLAGAVAAFGYALLAGFAVPTQRTFYMLAVVALAVWTGRVQSPSRVLATALFVVMGMDPWAVLSPGFWLSFGAVAVIFYVSAGRLGTATRLSHWVRIQGAVTLALVPLLLALFQQFSLVSPVANALAIPVVSLAVVPLTLAGALLPLDVFLVIAHELMAACGAVLERLSVAPAAVWQQHAPPAWSVPLAVVGVLWLLLPRGFPARWMGAVLLLPLALVSAERPGAGELWVDVLDVGQGLAVVARTERHTLVYDTGPAFGRDADSGGRVVVPFLRGEGVRRLDALVVSHDDADHAGGTRSVLATVPVARMWSSLADGHPLLAPDHPLSSAAAEHRRCRAGERWEWDGVRFEFLSPAPADYADSRRDDNDLSCVLKIEAAGGGALLAGDIGRAVERRLADTQADRLATTLLVAPHHGSSGSSSPAFVAAARPRAVVFTVGYRNPFGHPRAEVVDRFKALGAAVYRSDRDGALHARFTAQQGMTVIAYRAAARRYWHLP
ncbi:DNA internalization-related competence protein ComEC/Rec2 [Pelomicrobium methylotrophicum]|uniref:DNA internalization-related competence protein ComEC/Rec2 n=1 Tax=Pelomicrobium methylotrophicum TaxID=2602750 RepID=A0A5C7ESQ5_9PROT|nr:DNA internalization-related competence protein ComEC/Rec2 [Pelomicrobium methylotrophicum]TXF11701.1 DNA internalization-related competence protein ComEC/Rec2 [Pelomicrobium methylotrophicum]